MSGSSVSSSCSARIPSTLTTVSKPRTARLDLIRSTMLGSSSTTRAHVLRAASGVVENALSFCGSPMLDGRRELYRPASGGSRPGAGEVAVGDFGLDRQVHAEAGALGLRDQLDPAVVRLHDAPGD